MTEIEITTVAERPELAARLWDMEDLWPEFAGYDSVGRLLYPRMVTELPEYVLVATDGDEVVARAFSVPFALHAEGRGELPARGWDEVLLWAFSDLRRGVAPDTVSAIEITVATGRRGEGLSGRMLAAMRENARSRGFAEVVAPVRPSGKHAEPDTPIHAYAYRTREDGLPYDPWLRVHVRAGATVHGVAPLSMTISASVEDWRAWTGLPFDRPGPVHVPGALTPVHCDPSQGYAVYVEPNIWVRHPLPRPAAPRA
ncbi:N-acetyltransferase [Streptomyces antimicrobicus]|uniref:N-acetyltransferase n=1 Tax=Streptomyces antimicrobicus TaxID=2883108 RepID=A0ABS8BDR7_9ACTN|nr:N-acetyltransferase [Streptomyces antimicrobicus]MCB5182679.1 N-acetyltransferase [Streptomyces antimicrobicus]